MRRSGDGDMERCGDGDMAEGGDGIFDFCHVVLDK
jgi:hypothetical protein